MKRTKRLWALLCVLGLLTGLCGCGHAPADSSLPQSLPPIPENQPESIITTTAATTTPLTTTQTTTAGNTTTSDGSHQHNYTYSPIYDSALRKCACGAYLWTTTRLPEGATTKTSPTTSATKTRASTQWEDRPFTERFPYVEYGEHRYRIVGGAAPQEVVHRLLGTETVYDSSSQTISRPSHTVNVYAYETISPELFVLVQYAGDPAYYPAENITCRIDTLPAMLADVHLAEYIRFEKISCEVKNEAGLYIASGQYGAPEKDVFFEMLFGDPAVRNVAIREINRTGMVVYYSIPALGYENCRMWITDSGYLIFTAFGSEKRFRIGKQQVEAIRYYVTNYCETLHYSEYPNPATTYTRMVK